MAEFVFDMEWKVPEGGDVIRDAQKVWCAVFKLVGRDCWNEFTEDNFNQLTYFLNPKNHEKPPTYIAHNMIGADLHILRRFFGVNFTIFPDTIMGMPCKFIDTLSWSRRLWPDRPAVKGIKGVHGLEPWGERVGIGKPEVYDWSDQPIEVYLNRCRDDVLINEQTYLKLKEERRK